MKSISLHWGLEVPMMNEMIIEIMIWLMTKNDINVSNNNQQLRGQCSFICLWHRKPCPVPAWIRKVATGKVGSLTTSGKALRSRGSDSGRWWWGPRSASGGQAASSPGQAADSVHTVSHPPAPPQSHRAPHIARPPGIVTPRFPWDREP